MKHEDIMRLYTTNPENPNDPEGIRSYFQRVIFHMPGNVYWLNRDCITMGCNQNTLKALNLDSLKEFVGITYEKMADLAKWPEGQAEFFKANDMAVMEAGEARINIEEPPIYDSKGKPIYYISSRVPLFDEKGDVIGVVGISTDITDKKKLESQLIESKANEARFKTLSAVGGMIAHELRTPLASINGTSKSIQKFFPRLIQGYEEGVAQRNVTNPIRADLLDSIKQSLVGINQSVSYALSTIETILAGLHYSNTNQVLGETASFCLKTVVGKALQQYPLRKEHIDLIDSCNVEAIVISGEEKILIHVLHNLLKNALHAIDSCSRGEIKIISQDIGNKIKLVFSDTAKGITKEDLPHIFEPFYTTKKESAQSVGLGLYFCRMALERMGASIECQSQSGKYTRFIITLPKKH